LTVLAYNIRVGAGDAVTKPAPPHDETLAAIAAEITACGADIVLLQEVDRGVKRSGGTDQAAFLGERTGMHHAFGEALPLQDGGYGVAILSRWPLEDVQVLRLPFIDYAARGEDVPGYYSEPRVALFARTVTPLGPMVVASTHLGLTEEQRRLQTAHIAAHIATIDPGVPVLLGGDFNALPRSPELLPVRSTLADAYAVLGGSPPPHTFPSHDPDRTIDYLFLRGPAAWRSVSVPEWRLSDHRAVLATLTGPPASLAP
jgi:endonuclease/exonuclease/phosphatase family metal-dependent hydrolase